MTQSPQPQDDEALVRRARELLAQQFDGGMWSAWTKHCRDGSPLDNFSAGAIRAIVAALSEGRAVRPPLDDAAFEEIHDAAERSAREHSRKIRGQMITIRDNPAWHYMMATLDWADRKGASGAMGGA